MQPTVDGPVSPHFHPLPFSGNAALASLGDTGISRAMADALPYAPQGQCACWGIPFDVRDPALIIDEPVTVEVPHAVSPWLVFMHTSDLRPLQTDRGGLISPMRGQGHLNELAAIYTLIYEDDTTAVTEIRRRHHLGAFQRMWGENCFQAVAMHKPYPSRAAHEQLRGGWGQSQTRVEQPDGGRWVNWLWAWENPHPGKAITQIHFEPVSGAVLVFGIAAGAASEQPLRWRRRRKAVVSLPEGTVFRPELDEDGLLAHIQIDMGQIISAQPRLHYPNDAWETSYNNQLPRMSRPEVLIEYTSHPDAHFHVTGASSADGAPPRAQIVPVAAVEDGQGESEVASVPPARAAGQAARCGAGHRAPRNR